MTLRFIHLTDTHIGPHPQHLHYGYNVFDKLKALVHFINTDLPFEADFVLHTGDVMYDPDPVACQLAQKALSELKYPTYYARGNHDDPDAMRMYLPNLPLGTGRINYEFQIKDFHFIVLDTFGLVQPMGYLEPTQLEWLHTKCENSTAPSLVIVVHHLPVLTGNRWLDEQLLIENRNDLFSVLAPFQSRIRGLFFGHIHCPSSTFHNGILCSSAAASFSQFIFPADPQTHPSVTAPGGFALVTLTHQQTWVSHHFK